MKETAPVPAQRLRWDPTVTAGNVLTATAMTAALMIWGLRMEAQVAEHDRRIEVLEAERRRDNLETREIEKALARLGSESAAQTSALGRIEARLLQITQGVRAP